MFVLLLFLLCVCWRRVRSLSHTHPKKPTQVFKSSADAGLDQKRLLLRINSAGTVLSASAGAPKALFGFAPAAVVGRPLAAFVNVFGQWRRKFGEDESLLMLLATHAQERSEASWRVTVRPPVADADIGKEVSRVLFVFCVCFFVLRSLVLCVLVPCP